MSNRSNLGWTKTLHRKCPRHPLPADTVGNVQLNPTRANSLLALGKVQRKSSSSEALPNKVKRKWPFFAHFFRVSLSLNPAKAKQMNRFENGVTSKP